MFKNLIKGVLGIGLIVGLCLPSMGASTLNDVLVTGVATVNAISVTSETIGTVHVDRKSVV